MKNAIVLALTVLLTAKTTKVYSLPYQADSNGDCRNPKREYLADDSNLCCSKCAPGKRLIAECDDTTDSVCEPCLRDQHIENWNFSPNCFSCPKCKTNKGLQYARNCSSTTKSRCVCQPGMYCIMGFDDPYCAECRRYTLCKPGDGVSKEGTANSNVKCAPCPNGMFSDKNSYTESCKPHTNCHERAVVKKGNATSDTVCQHKVLSYIAMTVSQSNDQQTSFVYTTASLMTTTVSSVDSRLSASSYMPVTMINKPTKQLPPGFDIKSVAIITSVIGTILLFIIVLVLLVQCKVIRKKEAEIFHPKIDANGNCERNDEMHQDICVETQLTSFTINSLEQQCLLETGKPCNSLNQYSHDVEPLTRMEDYSSQEGESIGPLQSTIPESTLSEPVSLLTNSDLRFQPILPPQPTSQPTSPQLISPLANNPHVNVNITFHIGNGSCGTPPIIPTDSAPKDLTPDFPIGAEEEGFSMPQQEADKQSLKAVQESVSYDGWSPYEH
ncbi:tumor necrosis factor receptor superfamily member 1B [Polymixia lowei]